VERSVCAWNVATTGAGDCHVATADVDGISGSCACTTSGRNDANARRTANDQQGAIGATVP